MFDRANNLTESGIQEFLQAASAGLTYRCVRACRKLHLICCFGLVDLSTLPPLLPSSYLSLHCCALSLYLSLGRAAMEHLNKGSVIIKLVHYLPFLLHFLYLCLALFLSISALFGLSFCSVELLTYSLSFSANTRLIAFQGCRIIGLLSNFERDKYGNELRDRLARHGALETVTRAMGAHLVVCYESVSVSVSVQVSLAVPVSVPVSASVSVSS